MSEWVSCKDDLPSTQELVSVRRACGGGEERARMKVLEDGLYIWVYPSGLHWRFLEASDKWKRIELKVPLDEGKFIGPRHDEAVDFDNKLMGL